MIQNSDAKWPYQAPFSVSGFFLARPDPARHKKMPRYSSMKLDK
jgi:hypothetical protein